MRITCLAKQFAVALSIVLSATPAFAGDEKPERVQDMRYGAALYEYFQGNYLDALSELHVAEVEGGIGGHGNDPMLMRGGLSLAFGMEREATAIFQEILLQERSEGIHNAAWYYLGKMRYRRADWAGTADLLSNITEEQSKTLRVKLHALRTNLAVRLQGLDAASQLLAETKKPNTWTPYVYYNLGAAYIRSGDYPRGIAYLDELSQLELYSEEFLTLRDRALTAAGYALMLNQQFDEAVARFRGVRLVSPVVEKALLGYGWAAAEKQDYVTSLSPWTELSSYSRARPAVQEAMLAVPYAYEQLGAKAEALMAFETAELVFTEQIARIDALKSEVSPQSLVAALEQFDEDGPVDDNLVSLVSLLSADQFRIYTRDMRDLLTMRKKLDVWKRNLDIYKDLLVIRAEKRDARLKQISEQNHSKQLAELQAQRDSLATTVAEVSANFDAIAIADDDTRELWEISDKASGAYAVLKKSGDKLDAEAEQLRLMRGLLLWKASEDFSDNLWKIQKRLQQLDDALDTATANLQRLEHIQESTPDITPYEHRLAALEERLDKRLFAVNNNMGTTETALREMALKELNAQRERLVYYQAQARLAKARLYDTAGQGVN